MSDKVIKIVDGQPEGYPLYLINIIHVYPEFDDGVTREELQARGYDYVNEESMPTSPYIKNVVQNSCQLIDGMWTIKWSYEDMTDEERKNTSQQKLHNIKYELDQLENEIQFNIDNGVEVEKWTQYKQEIAEFRMLPVDDPFEVTIPSRPQ